MKQIRHPMFDEAKAMRSRLRVVDPNEQPAPVREATLWEEGKPNPALAVFILGSIAFWAGLAWWIWG